MVLNSGMQAEIAAERARPPAPLAGLTSAEAAERLVEYGPNVVETRRRRVILEFLSRFTNPLILVLLVASAISALTGDTTSFVIISIVVAISVTLDFIQEYRAGQAAERLKASVALRALAPPGR